MIDALLDLEGAYSRKTDPLSRDQRRKNVLKRGTSLGRFIGALYEAVATYNLDASRPQLLSHEDFKEGEECSPKELFISQQEQRRADARKKWSERELLTRFVDWEPRTVRDGRVLFDTVFYSSTRLVAWAEEQVRYGNPLDVHVKRFSSDPLYLIWKLPGSEEAEELTVIREDLNRIQNVTWQEFSLMTHAEEMLGLKETKKPKAGGRVTVKAHKEIRDAVRHRTATGEIHDIAGATQSEARQGVILANNRKWDEQTSAALGREKRPVMPPPPRPPAPRTPAQLEYDAWMKEKKAARDARRRESE